MKVGGRGERILDFNHETTPQAVRVCLWLCDILPNFTMLDYIACNFP